ncbi:unnamed protein product [Dracunculus medinensis]|uniref:Large ribosomal subunit protein uL24m n=1 Tax=Dracunculus medinensis TaxID=318479 RepID=A0A0N4UFU9_DRAME|nr:unnamed protein product [Dracunculus medinensis]
MRVNIAFRAVRRTYADLDYAMHMPKNYVERMKRIVPKKIYGNRFGAPDLIRWTLRPEDYEFGKERPWTAEELKKSFSYPSIVFMLAKNRLVINYFRKTERVPSEEWTIFPGDVVQVMVGKDKGKQGTVSHVIRDINIVFVQGMHMILKDQEKTKRFGVKEPLTWEEQPLDVTKNQVKLVDPNDNEPCEAKWILNAEETDYIRVSTRSGYEIPLPKRAFVTYDYIIPEKYMEVADKDTPAKIVLQQTYVPKLSSFEDDIMEDMGIREKRKAKSTYWY